MVDIETSPKLLGNPGIQILQKTMFLLTIRVVFCCLDNNITNVNGIQKISDAMR